MQPIAVPSPRTPRKITPPSRTVTIPPQTQTAGPTSQHPSPRLRSPPRPFSLEKPSMSLASPPCPSRPASWLSAMHPQVRLSSLPLTRHCSPSALQALPAHIRRSRRWVMAPSALSSSVIGMVRCPPTPPSLLCSAVVVPVQSGLAGVSSPSRG